MYDDFARHRQASRRRTQVLMVGFALMAAFALIRLGYLQLLHAQDFRDQIEDWLVLPEEYPQPLRGSILDRNGVVLAQDAPNWQVVVHYGALDGYTSSEDGRNPYIRDLAIAQLRAGGYPPGMDRRAALQAAEESVHQAIASSWQKLADLTGTPVWQILASGERIVERVRTIREIVEKNTGISQDIAEQRQYHPVLTDLSADMAAQIREQLPETQYPWLRVRAGAGRQYLDHASIVPLLGRLAEVSREDLKKDHNMGDDLLSLKPGEKIGISGVERMAEPLLRGKRGKIVLNRAGEKLVDIEPEWGQDVRLTIDSELQEWIYRRLSRAVQAWPTASGAAAVVLDTDSREILAAVSYPGYRQDDFARDYQRLRKDTIHTPLLLRAIAGQYEPGSIAKPVTVLAALNGGAVRPGDTITCTGYLIPGQKGWRCWTTSHAGMSGHGLLDAVGALKHSCNIYCVTAGERAGLPRLTDWMLRCGLGKAAGSGLFEEPDGLVPTPEWFRRRGRTPTAADIRNFSIGEGEVLVTPLQAANLAATIATGQWQPVTLMQDSVRAARQLPSRAEYLRMVRDGMFQVVNDRNGTAYQYAFSQNVAIAGKTGTAETSRRRIAVGYDLHLYDGTTKTVEFISEQDAQEAFAHMGESLVQARKTYTKYWPTLPDPEARPTHAWFMGYAPADHPKIALAVVIEYGGGGAKAAGPVGHDIFEHCFGIEGAPKGDKDVTIPDEDGTVG